MDYYTQPHFFKTLHESLFIFMNVNCWMLTFHDDWTSEFSQRRSTMIHGLSLLLHYCQSADWTLLENVERARKASARTRMSSLKATKWQKSRVSSLILPKSEKNQLFDDNMSSPKGRSFFWLNLFSSNRSPKFLTRQHNYSIIGQKFWLVNR